MKTIRLTNGQLAKLMRGEVVGHTSDRHPGLGAGHIIMAASTDHELEVRVLSARPLFGMRLFEFERNESLDEPTQT